MKIKSGFVVRKVGGKSVAVAVGELSKEFRGMITLNDTARLLWDRLQQDTDEMELAQTLIEEYDVSPAKAAADVEEMIGQLRAAGILEA